MNTEILVTYTNGQTMRLVGSLIESKFPGFIRLVTAGKSVYLNHENILGIEVKDAV